MSRVDRLKLLLIWVLLSVLGVVLPSIAGATVGAPELALIVVLAAALTAAYAVVRQRAARP